MVKEARRISVVLVLTAAWVSHSAVLPAECSDDDDCGPLQFCYRSGLCADCTVCSVYNRLPAETPCPRNPLHCGPCKPGFTAEVLINNEVRHSCVKSHSTNSSSSGSGSDFSPTLSDSLAKTLGIALPLLLLAFVCVCVWRYSRLQQCRRSNFKGFLSKSRAKVTQAFVGYKNEQCADTKTQNQNKDVEPSAPLLDKTWDHGSMEAGRTSAQLSQATSFRIPDYQHQPFNNQPSTAETSAPAPPAAETSAPAPPTAETSAPASSAAVPLLSALLPQAANAQNRHETPCIEQTVTNSSCSSSQSVVRNYNIFKVELVQGAAGRSPAATATAMMPVQGSSAVHSSL